MIGLFILFFGSTDDCIFDVFRLLPIVVNIADSSLVIRLNSNVIGHRAAPATERRQIPRIPISTPYCYSTTSTSWSHFLKKKECK